MSDTAQQFLLEGLHTNIRWCDQLLSALKNVL